MIDVLSRRVDGDRLAHTYTVEGRRFAVCDSTRAALKVIALFADEMLWPEEKYALLMRLMFLEPTEASTDELAELIWQAYGLDIKGDKPHEKPIFDWEQDMARVRSSLRMAYGLSWDDALDGMTYRETCEMLGMLLEADQSTPFREAVYYRTAKPPKRTKYNAAEVQAFNEKRKHYRLKSRDSEADRQRSERESSAVFEKLWRMAHG